MPITFTNQQFSQALRGQNVKVTLDSTDAAQLANISIGDTCSINSGFNYGIVYSIDQFGNSFEMIPIQPDLNCAGNTFTGYLAQADTVAI